VRANSERLRPPFASQTRLSAFSSRSVNRNTTSCSLRLVIVIANFGVQASSAPFTPIRPTCVVVFAIGLVAQIACGSHMYCDMLRSVRAAAAALGLAGRRGAADAHRGSRRPARPLPGQRRLPAHRGVPTTGRDTAEAVDWPMGEAAARLLERGLRFGTRDRAGTGLAVGGEGAAFRRAPSCQGESASSAGT